MTGNSDYGVICTTDDQPSQPLPPFEPPPAEPPPYIIDGAPPSYIIIGDISLLFDDTDSYTVYSYRCNHSVIPRDGEMMLLVRLVYRVILLFRLVLLFRPVY